MKKDSPVERFPGHVILPEYLTLSQVRAFEDVLDSVRDRFAVDDSEESEKIVWLSVVSEERLPVILMCVNEWHIEGVPDKPTIDIFPMTPVANANDLVKWLFDLIRELWIGDYEVPNA